MESTRATRSSKRKRGGNSPGIAGRRGSDVTDSSHGISNDSSGGNDGEEPTSERRLRPRKAKQEPEQHALKIAGKSSRPPRSRLANSTILGVNFRRSPRRRQSKPAASLKKSAALPDEVSFSSPRRSNRKVCGRNNNSNDKQENNGQRQPQEPTKKAPPKNTPHQEELEIEAERTVVKCDVENIPETIRFHSTVSAETFGTLFTSPEETRKFCRSLAREMTNGSTTVDFQCKCLELIETLFTQFDGPERDAFLILLDRYFLVDHVYGLLERFPQNLMLQRKGLASLCCFTSCQSILVRVATSTKDIPGIVLAAMKEFPSDVHVQLLSVQTICEYICNSPEVMVKALVETPGLLEALAATNTKFNNKQDSLAQRRIFKTNATIFIKLSLNMYKALKVQRRESKSTQI